MSLAHLLVCPRVRTFRGLCPASGLKCPLQKWGERGRGVSCCLYTIAWITQKSASMTMEDIQVAADTHTMLSLTETWLPGLAHLVPSHAWPRWVFCPCQKQLGLGDGEWVV